MEKITASDAFDILVKDRKKNILGNLGEYDLGKMKRYFIGAVDITVDINDESVKNAYHMALVHDIS